MDGYRHLPEVVRAGTGWCMAPCMPSCNMGHLPILLGGDHSLGLGSISAVARHCAESGKKLRVLWLDAHADFNTSALTPSGNVHGMPVACLCGFGPAELTQLAAMPGGRPRCTLRKSARSASAAWTRAKSVFVHEQGLEVFDMRAIDEVGMRQVMERALAGMDADTHLHVKLRRGLSGPRHRPRRRHHRARRPHLPRGAAVHGDDRRQRPPGFARHRGAEPRAGRAQQDRLCWRWTWWSRLFGKSTLIGAHGRFPMAQGQRPAQRQEKALTLYFQ